MPYTIEELKENPDFYFRVMLHDTIVLLGGRHDIAKMLDKSLDKPFTYDELSVLMQYNIDLLSLAKDRLFGVHSSKIKVAGPEE